MTSDRETANRIARLSDSKQRLLARLASAQGPRRMSDEPVAVLGLGCRFAGAESADAFWKLLCGGVDAITRVPADRWHEDRLDRFLSPGGASAVRWGGFIGDVAHFDPGFFGISPREARQMDPQHRVLLEQTWYAIEDASLSKTALAGSRTGVWMAVYHRDYARLALARGQTIDAYTGSGTHHGMAANRLSYLWDLRGPSITVDTACSSSLVALHLACRSLLAHEVDRALVGGVSLMLDPAESLVQALWGMLAPDGRCKTFDARADGFVRGEGCGVLVLERLRDVQATGRPVRAVVCGTAVNQDGRSNGLTAPNGLAQEAVVEAALADAGLSASRVSYIEAHGTGTALGDPIEMAALMAILGRARPHAGCLVGSVKTNIGHCEAASGMAGVIKAVLCLEQREIPRSLHFETLNPAIGLAGSALRVASTHQSWNSEGEPRVAGVSSFGAGGTNAHVLLREAPMTAPLSREQAPEGSRSHLLTLSGPDAQALVSQVMAYVSDSSTDELGAICTAASRRTHHRHRLAVVASSRAEMHARLKAWCRDGARSEAISTQPGTWGGVVFMFPGQGSQWRGMGLGLRASDPEFRSTLDRCHEALKQRAGFSLHDVLNASQDDPRLERIEFVQPALTAIMIALADLWRSWGVRPDAVIGLSMGEIVGAHVAGALTLEQALQVVVTRSRLMGRLRGQGMMVAVNLTGSEATAAIAGREHALSVAVITSPEWTVISGENRSLREVVDALTRRGVECRRVAVDVASHNPAMDALRESLLSKLATLTPRSGTIPFYSSVDCRQRDGSSLDGRYWTRNLREPARVWDTIVRMAREGYTNLLEVSPHPVLVPPLTSSLEKHTSLRVCSVGSLYRDCDERAAMLASLGRLHERGVAVDWSRVMPDVSRRVALPRYAFKRERYWLPGAGRNPWTDRTAAFEQSDRFVSEYRPLCGRRQHLAHEPETAIFNLTLDTAHMPFLNDHTVEGERVLPGVSSVEIAVAAAHELWPDSPKALTGVRFERAIIVPESGALALQLVVRGDRFELYSAHVGTTSWGRAARGHYLDAPSLADSPGFDTAAVRARCISESRGADFYNRLNATGNTWGPSFQAVQTLWCRPGEILVELVVPDPIRDTLKRYIFHPALLDACGHALLETLQNDTLESARGPFVFAEITRAQLHGTPTRHMWGHITMAHEQRPRSLTVDVRAYDDAGHLRVEMLGCRVQFLHQNAFREERFIRVAHWLHEVVWEPIENPSDNLSADDLRARASDTVLRLGSDEDTGLLDECWRVVQAVRRVSESGDRLWLATCGAVCPVESIVYPHQTALWALAQSLAAERPSAIGGLIDLDPQEPRSVSDDRLATILEQGLVHRQVALRGDDVYLPHVRRLSTVSEDRAADEFAGRLRRDSAYVVTGGLGGLGLALARRLAERGARHLVLLGRSGLPPRSAWADLEDGATTRICQTVRDIESLGASVHIAAADVGDPAALERFASRWMAEVRPPVRGVFHAAGVQRRAGLAEMNRDHLAEELHAKVDGTRAIWRIWGPGLELLVLYSSASTVLPSPFIAGYAAANGFLDGFAQAHRDTDVTVLAIDWGVWGEVGLAARFSEQTGRSLKHKGMGVMESGRALDGLEMALAIGLPRVAVMALDGTRWTGHSTLSSHGPLLHDGVLDRTCDALSEGAPLPHRVKREQLSEPEALADYTRKRIAQVLRARPSAIDMERPLVELGLDSLMALELRRRLENDLAIVVPVVFLLQECTGDVLIARISSGLTTPIDTTHDPRADMQELII